MAEIPFFQDPFADSNPISEIDQPIDTSIESMSQQLQTETPETSQLPIAPVAPAEPATLPTPDTIQVAPIPTQPQPLTTPPLTPPPAQRVEITETPEVRAENRRIGINQSVAEFNSTVRGESNAIGGQNFNVSMELLKHSGRLRDQDRRFRSGTQQWSPDRFGTFKSGAPPTRLGMQETEAALVKFNKIASNPQTAAPISETEWNGMTEILQGSPFGRRMMQQRSVSQQESHNAFLEASATITNTADLAKWIDEAAENPLVSEWIGAHVGTILSGREGAAISQKIAAGDAALARTNAAQAKLDKEAALDRIAFTQNKGSYAFYLQQTGQASSSEEARTIIDNIRLGDATNPDFINYQSWQADKTNEAATSNGKTVVKQEPSKDQLERRAVEDQAIKIGTVGTYDLGNSVDRTILVERGGMSARSAEFFEFSQDVLDSLPPVPEGVPHGLRGGGALQRSMSDQIRIRINAAGSYTAETFASIAKEVLSEQIEAGSIQNVTVDEAYGLFATDLFQSVGASFQRDAEGAKRFIQREQLEKNKTLLDRIDQFTTKFSVAGDDAARIAFADSVENDQGVRGYLTRRFGLMNEVQREFVGRSLAAAEISPAENPSKQIQNAYNAVNNAYLSGVAARFDRDAAVARQFSREKQEERLQLNDELIRSGFNPNEFTAREATGESAYINDNGNFIMFGTRPAPVLPASDAGAIAAGPSSPQDDPSFYGVNAVSLRETYQGLASEDDQTLFLALVGNNRGVYGLTKTPVELKMISDAMQGKPLEGVPVLGTKENNLPGFPSQPARDSQRTWLATFNATVTKRQTEGRDKLTKDDFIALQLPEQYSLAQNQPEVQAALRAGKGDLGISLAHHYTVNLNKQSIVQQNRVAVSEMEQSLVDMRAADRVDGVLRDWEGRLIPATANGTVAASTLNSVLDRWIDADRDIRSARLSGTNVVGVGERRSTILNSRGGFLVPGRDGISDFRKNLSGVLQEELEAERTYPQSELDAITKFAENMGTGANVFVPTPRRVAATIASALSPLPATLR